MMSRSRSTLDLDVHLLIHTKYASHLDLDPYKIMSSKQMSRSMSKSTFTYFFMISKSIIKYASHLDQFKMMSSNVAK